MLRPNQQDAAIHKRDFNAQSRFKAPAFALKSDKGQEVALKDFAGQPCSTLFIPQSQHLWLNRSKRRVSRRKRRLRQARVAILA